MNYGGSRKTISSAYCNKGGSRKQFYPYATSTVYTYREYTVNSWTKKALGVEAWLPLSAYTSMSESYNFDDTTGTFSLTGSRTPRAPAVSEENTQSSVQVSQYTSFYYLYSSRIMVTCSAYAYLNVFGTAGIFGSVHYAYPKGYSSSSYNDKTSSSKLSTGYQQSSYTYIEIVTSWDLNGDASYLDLNTTDCPIYDPGIYRVEI